MSKAPTQPPTEDSRDRDIFLDALELPEAERADFVAKACKGDQSLQRAVESLLQNHRTDAFLETPVFNASAVGSIGAGWGEVAQVGDRIGRYRLLQKLGEGGCGVVYLAEQTDPVRRRVALKIIKLGMDTEHVIARFEAERQALAMMDHPNIARVLDGGATELGRPYFVMELVEGVRITSFCDEHQLSTRDRLNLFIQVCHAVQHAHQKGVIHRDLKPSNILVTVDSGTAVPKIIDFGIAKAIEEPLTDKALVTQFHSFLGTPAYTSPEQAQWQGRDVDTRSDIYSLGILLYELLTGRTPFDPEQLMQAGVDEMRRMLRETDPPRPSTSVARLSSSTAAALEQTRQETVPALLHTLRGDLDWVVMKCLEKDRGRRYETANALASDLQRYLDNEPVLARRPSATYRLKKFAQRNRVGVAASVVIALVLVAGLIVSSWLAIRATQAEREEAHLRREVEAALKKEGVLREGAQADRAAAVRRAYNSDMNLVQQALIANNYGRVLDLLGRYQPDVNTSWRDRRPVPVPDLRGWEWRYFWDQARSETAFQFPQQPGSVLALSPDGRLLLTQAGRGALTVWDVKSRTVLTTIDERAGRWVVFSHDSSRVALVTGGGPEPARIKIWSTAKRQFVAEARAPDGLRAAIFSPDDRQLLTFSGESSIQRLDLAHPVERLQPPAPSIRRGRPGPARFSANGRRLAALEDGEVRILDTATGRQQATTGRLDFEAASLALSPDGERLAVGPLFTATNTSIHLFSATTGKPAGTLVGHVSWVPDLTFSPDGKELISAGGDETVRVWDVEQAREVAKFHGQLSEIYRLVVSGDGRLAITGCKDGTVFGWDLAKRPSSSTYKVLSRAVQSIQFFPDSRSMLSVDRQSDGGITLWDTRTLEPVEQVAGLRMNPQRVLISPDGARVYYGTREGQTIVMDWATRHVIATLPTAAPAGPRFGPRTINGPIGFLNGGRTLLVQENGFTVRLFDTASLETRGEWQLKPNGDFLPSDKRPLLSPDERFLVVIGMDGKAQFCDPHTGVFEETVAIQRQRVSDMAFSPDSTCFATSSVDGTVDLWDCKQHQRIDVLRGHLLGIESVSFSPDGQRLVTTSHGAEAVKIWDVATRHEVATLAGEGSLFRQVQFSPDGTLLVAINIQGQAHIWRAPPLDAVPSATTRSK